MLDKKPFSTPRRPVARKRLLPRLVPFGSRRSGHRALNKYYSDFRHGRLALTVPIAQPERSIELDIRGQEYSNAGLHLHIIWHVLYSFAASQAEDQARSVPRLGTTPGGFCSAGPDQPFPFRCRMREGRL